MKVLIINGSPRAGGNTSIALNEMIQVFQEEGVEVETVDVGMKNIHGCIACTKCYTLGKCVFNDIVNETAAKLPEIDGMGGGQPRILRLRKRQPDFLPGSTVLQQIL